MLRIAVRFPDFPCTASRSRIKISLYNFFCMALMPMKRIVSCLGGRLDSTSFFKRLSIKGLKILCSWEINLFFSSLSSISRLNQSLNCSALANTSGTKKFKRLKLKIETMQGTLDAAENFLWSDRDFCLQFPKRILEWCAVCNRNKNG